MPKHRPLITACGLAALLPIGAAADTVGVATWYGARHSGKHTSNGDVFNEDGMTAASNHFAMGSRVRVTLRDTGESVVVRVNDRMGSNGSTIDLTKGAARQIGMLGRGRAAVSITRAENEPVEVAEASGSGTPDLITAVPRGPRHMHPGVR